MSSAVARAASAAAALRSTVGKRAAAAVRCAGVHVVRLQQQEVLPLGMDSHATLLVSDFCYDYHGEFFGVR